MPKKMTKKERETPFRTRALRISKTVKKSAKGWLGKQKKRGGWPFS